MHATVSSRTLEEMNESRQKGDFISGICGAAFTVLLWASLPSAHHLSPNSASHPSSCKTWCFTFPMLNIPAYIHSLLGPPVSTPINQIHVNTASFLISLDSV